MKWPWTSLCIRMLCHPFLTMRLYVSPLTFSAFTCWLVVMSRLPSTACIANPLQLYIGSAIAILIPVIMPKSCFKCDQDNKKCEWDGIPNPIDPNRLTALLSLENVPTNSATVTRPWSPLPANPMTRSKTTAPSVHPHLISYVEIPLHAKWCCSISVANPEIAVEEENVLVKQVWMARLPTYVLWIIADIGSFQSQILLSTLFPTRWGQCNLLDFIRLLLPLVWPLCLLLIVWMSLLPCPWSLHCNMLKIGLYASEYLLPLSKRSWILLSDRLIGFESRLLWLKNMRKHKSVLICIVLRSVLALL